MKKYTKLPIIASLVTACAFGALLQSPAALRPAFAEELPFPKSQTPVDPGKPQHIRIEMNGSTLNIELPINGFIKISADAVEYNDKTRTSKCEGNVRISVEEDGKEIWFLKAEKAMVQMSPNQVSSQEKSDSSKK